MEHEIRTTYGLRQGILVQRVAPHEKEMGRPLCLLQKLGPASRKVVVTNHLVTGSQKTIRQVASDETGGPSHKVAHSSILKPKGTWRPLVLWEQNPNTWRPLL